MFSWSDIPDAMSLQRCLAAVRTKMEFVNYGFGPGQWNITDIIKSDDPRKDLCMYVFEGKLEDGKVYEDQKLVGLDGNPMLFKLKVLTRQACTNDSDGHRIFKSKSGLDKSGDTGDFVSEFGDLPHPGDEISFKISFKSRDEDGLRMTTSKLMSKVMDGQDIYSRRVCRVDKDLCITLPNPFALSALQRHGYRISFPEWDVQYKPRKVSNWWFQEVPLNFHMEIQPDLEIASRGKK
jgi:hypothetical protein